MGTAINVIINLSARPVSLFLVLSVCFLRSRFDQARIKIELIQRPSCSQRRLRANIQLFFFYRATIDANSLEYEQARYVTSQ